MMKKLYSPFFLRTAFVVLLMLTAVKGWGQKTYQLITSTTDLTAGSNYLVVSRSTAGNGFALGYQAANNRPKASVTISSSLTITTTPATANSSTTSAFEFTLGGTSGAWTIYDSANGGYLYAANTGSSTNNYLRNRITPIDNWTVTFSGASAIMTDISNTTSRNILRYNGSTTGSEIFSCYASGQSDVYLYKEVPSGFTVIFNSNGGNGSMVNQTASTPTALNPNSFTRTGYSFTNWNTTASASGTSYADMATYPFSASETLYAQWSINSYNVSYDLNGGSGTTPTTQTGDYNTNITLANGAGFTRAGFTFNGWNTAANGSGTAFASGGTYTIPALSQTLYAQWTAVPALTPPTLTAASGATVDNPFAVTFADNAAWRTAITSITVAGTPLTAGYALSAGNITFTPSASVPANLLQQGGLKNIVVIATGYSDAPVSQPINAGAPVKIVISTQPAGPTANGGLLFTQPILDLSDQYNNPTGATSATVTATVGAGAWTLGGTTVVSSVGSSMTYSNLTATSAAEVLGATMVFTATGFPPVTSGPFNIPPPVLPAITSGLSKSTIYGTADSYTITASGSPTSFNATGLPAGLSVNTTTGVISGTPSADVGPYNVTISATNANGTDTKTLVWTITQRPLTITGVTGVGKVYDRLTTATLGGTPVLNNVVFSDNVSITGTPTANFADYNVGTRAITVTGFTLGGTKAGNYTVSQPTGLSASITAKPLTVTSAAAQNKSYDGNNTAIITGATLVGVISPDDVSVSGGGTFADANVGTAKPITANLILGGTNANNYSITQPTGLTANITATVPSAPTITLITPSNGQLSVAFTAPANNGGTAITNYAYSTNGGSTFTVISPTQTISPIVITGLTNGTTYSVIVRAINSLGQGANSNTLTGTPTIAAQSTDRFRSRQSGNWATASTWESSPDGISWLSPTTLSPTSSATSVEILNGFTVTTAAAATAKNLTVKSGGKLQLNSAITNSGNFTIEDLGTVVVNFITSNPATNLWAGTENFAAQSSFIVNRWDRTVELFANVNDVTTNSTTGAKFGNLNIDLGTAGITANWTGIFPLNTFNLTDNDLTISNSTAFNVTLNPQTVTIGKNFIIGGSGNVVGQSQAGTKILNVKGDFEKNGSGQFRLSNSGTSYIANLNIDGNFTVNDGTFVLDQGSTGASTSIVNLKGNLSKTTVAFMTNANGNSLTNAFNFVGNVLQTVNLNVGASNDMLRYSFFIKNGAVVMPIVQDWKLATDSRITVENGGTLDFGFNGTTALNIIRVAATSGQSFNAASGSTLKITSPDGISNGTSVYIGNVQIGASTATRVFDPGAIYHYIGKSATQSTGNALPDGLTNKVIVDLQTDSTNENLNFTANGSVKFNSTGTLEIRRGKAIDAPGNGFRNNIAVENEDGESDAQKGNLLMSGGRYVVSGSGTKPSLSGNYTFTGGTVEFAGPVSPATTSSKIRTGVTPKQYFNVDVSGNNVEAGGKNLIVNEVLKVTNATASLTIPAVADNIDSYIVTAKKGIQVTTGGQAIFQNNAQLMQDAGASNTGNIKMERIATIPVSTFNQFVYWSSPVIGQNFKTIFGGDAEAMYYNETNNKFYASSGAYIAGRGLAVKNPVIANSTGVTSTAAFTGTPYNTDLNYNLAFSNADHGYNLVGNPYPSNLDLNTLYANNSGAIESTFRFWDNTNNEQQTQLGSTYNGSSYAIYNASSGTGIPSPGDGSTAPNNPGKKPNNILKVGQGFLVRAKVASAVLGFKGTQRITAQANAQYYGKTSDSIVDRYLLELVTPSNLVFSNAVVYFDNGNNSFTQDDSKFDAGLSEGLFTKSDEEKVVINGRNIFTNNDIVKLGSRNFIAGNNVIRLGTKEGVFANGQNIYLKDKQAGIITNLSQGSYTFSADTGEINNRFEIIYKPEAILASDAVTKESLQVYRNGENFIVKSGQNKIDKVEVYDVTGRLVKSVKGNSSEIIIEASSLSSGMYILNINRNNQTINKKIIK